MNSPAFFIDIREQYEGNSRVISTATRTLHIHRQTERPLTANLAPLVIRELQLRYRRR